MYIFRVLIFLLMNAISIVKFSHNCMGQEQLPPIDLSKVDPSCLPYRLEIIKTLSPKAIYIPADLDNDGTDELIVTINSPPQSTVPNGIQIESIDPRGTRFRENFSGIVLISDLFFDVDGDDKKEIFVSERKSDTTFFHVLDNEGKKVYSTVAATPPIGIKREWEWDCDVFAEAVLDVNGDGWQDILLTVQTGYAYQPRGLCVFDVHNKKLVWKYLTGFVPRSPQLYDINGDGRREVLLGSTSPDNGNGVPVNGTDDKHTYFTILDSLGNRLHSQKVGNEFTRVRIYQHDLKGYGKPEVLVIFDCHKEPKTNSFIGLFNHQNYNIKPKIHFAKNPSSNLAFLDADRNGRDDIFIGWSDGTIEIRDHSLEILRTMQFPDFIPESFIVSDLNNDSDEDIIVSGLFKGQKLTVIINRKMQLMAYCDHDVLVSNHENSVVTTGFGEDKLLIAYGNIGSHLLGMKKQFVILNVVSWRWLGYGFLSGALFAGVFLSIFLTTKHRKFTKRLLESIIHSDHVGLIAFDSEGRVIEMNQEMEKIFGIDRDCMIGLTYKKIFSDSNFNELLHIIDSSYQEKRAHFEKEITTLWNGTPSFLLVSVGTFPSGKRKSSGRLVTIRNITDMVHSRQAVAWASMAQKLAHEIKTPLSTVMLSAQHLQMELKKKEKKTKKSDKYVGHIIGQVDRLRKMTNDFLKFARIEKLNLESVDMNKLVEECIKNNRIKMGSGIRLETYLASNLPHPSVDRQQLLVALQNLIDNSLNSMDGEGILTITTRLVQSLQTESSERTSEAIQIEISDTGRGIPEEHLSQLFQPFFSKSPGGTGMGLIIVKKIIDDHNGSIRIESEVGIGTTVFLTLPA